MDMNNRACTACFTGHRFIDKGLNTEAMERLILKLIKDDYDTFICGGALGFDTVAAKAVLRYREKYPHIKLHLYLPCNDQDVRWNSVDRAEYKSILEKADRVIMPDTSYYDGCMRERNFKMVDSSSVCVCYLSNFGKSGTAQTVRYAVKNGLKVFNVAKCTD